MRQLLAVVVAAALRLGAAAPAAPPDSPVNYVKVDEVKGLLDRGTDLDIIDVRTAPGFDELHIHGARSMPFRALPQRLAEVPKDRPVVFYCACPHALSVGASPIAYERGYRNQRVLDEGLPGWVQKGYPVVHGMPPAPR